MPFKSCKQEAYMKANHPDLWKKWVRKYGHCTPTESEKKDKKK